MINVANNSFPSLQELLYPLHRHPIQCLLSYLEQLHGADLVQSRNRKLHFAHLRSD